ncbi:MAG TPA: hypothetical protein VFI91_11920 [Longimicrobiaceae bacterium]|nr:hypothetical protein [Longimicrobiaceae bacterium]
MKRIYQNCGVVMAALALAACGGADGESEAAADREMAGEAATEPTGDIAGMPGMEGMMQSGSMMEQMHAHMQMMQGLGPDSLMVMMPEHRQMVANMLAQMNLEMREMNMADDPEWNEMVAALRDDLIRLPEMTADELQAFIPEHQTRIEVIMEMHRSMMGDMQM